MIKTYKIKFLESKKKIKQNFQNKIQAFFLEDCHTQHVI